MMNKILHDHEENEKVNNQLKTYSHKFSVDIFTSSCK